MIFSPCLDLNIQDANGWTPLHHAVKNNALAAIEFLLDYGVDDVRLNKQHEAPIHLTVVHNQLDALNVSQTCSNLSSTLLFLVNSYKTARSSGSSR